MTGTEVRQAVPSDAPGIAEVHVRGWQVGYRGLLPAAFLDGLEVSDRLERWTGILAVDGWPRRGTLVAVDGARVLGFVSVGPVRDADLDPSTSGEVLSFYVDPGLWRGGVGRLLMTAAHETLTAVGFTSATLWVLETNARARAFYAALGWHPDDHRKTDEVAGVSVNEVRLRRTLPPPGR